MVDERIAIGSLNEGFTDGAIRLRVAFGIDRRRQISVKDTDIQSLVAGDTVHPIGEGIHIAIAIEPRVRDAGIVEHVHADLRLLVRGGLADPLHGAGINCHFARRKQRCQGECHESHGG